MEKSKKLFENFKYEIDFDVAEMFSRNNCKKCLGKGILESTHNFGRPIKRDDFSQKTTYCDCVRKNSQKYS